MLLVSHRDKPFASPILCYVTDRKSLASVSDGERSDDRFGTLLRRIAAASAAGVDWIQIREINLSAKETSSLTREALAQTNRANQRDGVTTRIIVNDRLDIAFSERASGVHLGERSLPGREVREWLDAQADRAVRGNFLVGVSCHSLESAESAAQSGADYIFFGPVFATPSKAAFGAPQGLTLLAEICRSVDIPVLAIGGIVPENAAACFAAGAAGIAAIRLFQETADLPSLLPALRARS
jgi:thiamine-phosphate pyrophosphorylase